MITSLPNREEVKQILQLLNDEEEITEEQIDDAIEGGMFFVNMTEQEVNSIFPPVQERLINESTK
jgi:pheromone shutdown protein TraB